jgi:protein-disulfide isomerase
MPEMPHSSKRFAVVFLILLTGSIAGWCQVMDPPRGVRLNLSGYPALGDASAKVVMVEFGDYQCPACNQQFVFNVGRIVEEYVKTGKLKYVFRDFPGQATHPQAEKAAEAVHCAGEQGRYWEMHDRFLSGKVPLEPPMLPLHAQMVRLDVPRFEAFLSSGKYTTRVRESVAEGKKAGVEATPWIFLGIGSVDGTSLQPAVAIQGAQPIEVFRAEIDRLLRLSARKAEN